MRKILFYGELPPNAIHGVSLSNMMNLEMLESAFNVDVVEEYSQIQEHDKITFQKLSKLIKNNIDIASKSILHRYDYFYTTFSLSTFGSLKTLAAIFNFRIFNKGKVIVHLHRGDFFTNFYNNTINKFIAKCIFGLSEKIIVLSDNQKAEFESSFKRSFFVLFNTVEIENVRTSKKTSSLKFLFISNYLIDKGILDLLVVFKSLSIQNKDLSLKTYGAFSDQELKRQILEYNSANIHINTTITGINKFTEIADADCVILPSWNEGQPIVILEAMAVGTPVIASRVGLIPELLGVDYPYLFEKGNTNSLKKTILQFISNNDSSIISEKLQERYEMHYSHKMHIERLSSIFN